jgi:hypothetical protein
LGVSDVSTSGEVFNLKNIADFDGTYVAGEAGIAIVTGPTDTVMKNEKGVVLRVHGTQKGARMTLAAQGVKLKVKNEARRRGAVPPAATATAASPNGSRNKQGRPGRSIAGAGLESGRERRTARSCSSIGFLITNCASRPSVYHPRRPATIAHQVDQHA